MGKKKPFIDKKKAQTYRLVPRSQQDPLAENVDEAQYVLKALQEGDSAHQQPLTEEYRLTEQHKYGIYYNDEYDYLQHLKEPGTAVLEPVQVPSGQKGGMADGQEQKIGLPGDLFGSEVTVDGKLDKIVPVAGPQPDWDPDIVAALEDAEMNSDTCEGDLDDDFVLLANAGEPGVPVYVTEETGDSDDRDAWWKTRVDFTVDKGCLSNQLESDDGSSVNSDLVDADDVLERKSTRFTEYSLSSSVVPRSEALTMLDDCFEEFMAEYEDSELGAVDEECESGGCDSGGGSEYEQLLLQAAVDNFEKHFKQQLHTVEELQESVVPPPLKQTVRDSVGVEDGADDDVEGESEGSVSGDSSDERLVPMEVTEKPKEKWDCESILSTYSNVYNHPTKIVEPRPPSLARKDHIKLSTKTNLPLGVLPGSLPKEKQPKQATTTRPRNEDKEDKKARKQSVKEERKQRRAEKKATKLAFKSESLRLEKQLAGRLSTAAVV